MQSQAKCSNFNINLIRYQTLVNVIHDVTRRELFFWYMQLQNVVRLYKSVDVPFILSGWYSWVGTGRDSTWTPGVLDIMTMFYMRCCFSVSTYVGDRDIGVYYMFSDDRNALPEVGVPARTWLNTMVRPSVVRIR